MLVAIRIIVLFTLTLSCPAIDALAGRASLRERVTFEPAARRQNEGDPLAMLRIVGCALFSRPRFTIGEPTILEKSPGVTRLPNRLMFLKTSDGSLRFRNATYSVAVLVRPEFRPKKAKMKPKIVTASTPALLDRQDEVDPVGL